MKKRSSRLLALILAISLLLGALSVSVFASADEAAENFNQMVAQVPLTESIYEKSLYLEAASDYLNEYLAEGGSIEDEAISAAYEEYITLKPMLDKIVEDCENFLYYIECAMNALSYEELKENLLLAAELFDSVDTSYDGISSSKLTYSSINIELKKAENLCDLYITHANDALSANNYRAKKTACDKSYKILENDLIALYPGIETAYPGMSAASAKIANVEAELAAILFEASDFLVAVREIALAESVPAGILAAYAALEGVDKTADGVDIAIKELENYEKEYNAKVEAANDLAKNSALLIFGIIA